MVKNILRSNGFRYFLLEKMALLIGAGLVAAAGALMVLYRPGPDSDSDGEQEWQHIEKTAPERQKMVAASKYDRVEVSAAYYHEEQNPDLVQAAFKEFDFVVTETLPPGTVGVPPGQIVVYGTLPERNLPRFERLRWLTSVEYVTTVI